jgi:hypothetical protein
MSPVGSLEAPLLRKSSVNERQVDLLHRSALELGLQRGQGLVVAGHDVAPRRLLVEPVYESETPSAGHVAAQSVEQRVHDRGMGRAPCGMDDHAGSLVEDDEVPVLVQHIQREVLRHDPGRLGRRDLHLDPLPSTQPGRRLGRAPVHPDETCGQESLDPGAREGRCEAGDGHVETKAHFAIARQEFEGIDQRRLASPDPGLHVSLGAQDDVHDGSVVVVGPGIEGRGNPGTIQVSPLLQLLAERVEEVVLLDGADDLLLVVERNVGANGARQPDGLFGRLDERHVLMLTP